MSDDHPDARRYGPWIIFLLVLALFLWAHNAGIIFGK